MAGLPTSLRRSRQRSGLSRVGSLRRKLRKLPGALTEPVRDAVEDGAELVKFEQLARVPREEGDLAGSIEIKYGRDRFSADIGPGARTKTARRRAGWRAHFAEFGTRLAAAQPFIFPALERWARPIIGDIEVAVNRVLRRAGNL